MKTNTRKPVMPKWRPVPEALQRTFVDAAARLNGVEIKKMFGCPCAFVNGNMMAGVHQENLLVRLPADERTVAVDERGWKPFEPMPGRPMREYVVLPPAVIGVPTELDAWLSRALAYTASLPAKQPKKPARKPGIKPA